MAGTLQTAHAHIAHPPLVQSAMPAKELATADLMRASVTRYSRIPSIGLPNNSIASVHCLLSQSAMYRFSKCKSIA